MYTTLVINVDELWLKGRNRPVYYRAINNHVSTLLSFYHRENYHCKNEEQRLVAKSVTPFSNELIDALLKVPGIHSVIPARSIKVDFNYIFPSVLEELSTIDKEGKTFRVVTKRVNKKFPLNSMEISRRIGELVLQQNPSMKVNLTNPSLTIEIRVLRDNIYVSTKKCMGIGGQPCGTSGHVITLLSGGFDSPVASYLMSKRGCSQTFIFFYAYPFVGQNVVDKIISLAKVLGQFQKESILYVVPFGDIQKKISDYCRPEYRTLFFRKYMMDISGLLCSKLGADGLVTGDSLSQVSSQTIFNIGIIDKHIDHVILRPLIGFNKSEIISLAKQINTHDISVIPHDDACSLFSPKHPIIRPDKNYFASFIEKNPMIEEINICLDQSEIYEINLRGDILKKI